MLKTAVVGAGTVATNGHLPLLKRNPRVDLKAVCDADEERAKSAANKYGINYETDTEQLFNSYNLGWVHICTPVQTHLEIAKQAIDTDIPVLIQKPITNTISEFNELKDYSESNSVPVTAVHNQAFLPLIRDLRAEINGGSLGEILGVDVVLAGEGRPDETPRGSWVFDLPGGEFEEGLPHPIYLALVTGGYPKSEQSIFASSRLFETYDHNIQYDGVGVSYESKSGALCSIKVLAGGPEQNKVHVYGSNGSLTVDLTTMNRIQNTSWKNSPSPVQVINNNFIQLGDILSGIVSNSVDFVKYMSESKLNRHSEESVSGHYYLFNETAKSIEFNIEPPVPLEEAEWTIKIMEEIRSSV